MSKPTPIPREIALRLCKEICEENARKKIKFLGLQCWGCLKFGKGDPEKMCLSNGADYNGCQMINKRYAELYEKR